MTDTLTPCDHEDERGSTVMRVRDDRWECAVCGITFRLVREADAIDTDMRLAHIDTLTAPGLPAPEVQRTVMDWLGPCCTKPTPGCIVCGFRPEGVA